LVNLTLFKISVEPNFQLQKI